MAHNSQVVRANLDFATVGPAEDMHQAQINTRKLYVSADIESET